VDGFPIPFVYKVKSPLAGKIMSNQKEPTGPRLSSVIIIGFLIFGIGKLLGLASLISQPVTVTTKALDPESIIPGVVYYQKGSSSGRTVWRAKEEAWKDGTVNVLSLSETELNQWSRDRLKVSPAPTSEDGAGWTERMQLNVTQVNFRILEDQIQMATEIQMGDMFDGKTFIYQVFGKFEGGPEGVRFVPKKGSLGFAPIGSVPIYRDLFFRWS
jgi:hypothetical protein